MSDDTFRARNSRIFTSIGLSGPSTLDLHAIDRFESRCAAFSQAQWGELTSTEVARFRQILAGVGSDSLRPYARGLLNQAIARADKLEYHLAVSPIRMSTRVLSDAAKELCETLASLKAEGRAEILPVERPV